MHIADLDLGILGANGIVGGGPPLSTGAALTAQYRGTDNVCVCFLGDGASNQGTTHEAMNLAAVWKLPVVFVVENNGVAEFTRQTDHQTIQSITERAAGYDMPSASVDGNDVIAVYEAASEAVERARTGKGPTLVECMTFRLAGHYVGDPEKYRTTEEVDSWKTDDKDPISRFKKILLSKEICDSTLFDEIRKNLQQELEDAVKFAEESPEPDIEDLLSDVYHN
jgi:pyruvate dehydrogenase E1 component alpha subunit